MLTERFRDALAFAAWLHRDQLRKATDVPYVAHLLAVASIVLEHGGSEDEAIAALLHDAVEDQGGAETRERIRERFGDRVVEIVDGCTDAEVLPKPPWRARKEAHLARLPSESASVHLVSAADKLHNARSILSDYRVLGPSLWERFRGGREGTLWYYGSVADIFRGQCPEALSDELDRTVAELVRLVESERR